MIQPVKVEALSVAIQLELFASRSSFFHASVSAFTILSAFPLPSKLSKP